MPELHVSPDGDDSWPGTEAQPFATLAHAVQEAGSGTVVLLRAGTHILSEPLDITTDDVTFQAYGYGTAAREEAVVSGGRRITGWQVRDGLWLADVGELDTRQLYVDGRRAERAAVDQIPGTVTATETGYVTDVTLGWHSPGDVEFVHRGVYPWTEARVPVAAADVTGDGSTVVTMAPEVFVRARELYNFSWDGQISKGPGLPTRVENDASFHTEPGTFVLDRSQPGRHVLRYRPRPGEDPGHTQVVAPVLPTLLRVAGSRRVAFEGLVFAEATWLRPGTHGFLHYHGTGFYEGGGVEKVTFAEGQAWVFVPSAAVHIPACVSVEDGTDVRFEGCRFTRLGATGLALTGGSRLVVRGCDFDTLAAAGVTVSGGREVLVEQNHVTRVGLDYPGSPGIEINGTRDCTVAVNHVDDVPHCGIVAGPAHGTRLLRNLLTDTMGVLADGGGLYVSGPQGTGPGDGALVAGNVIENVRTPYNFGLYTDYGAAWVTVEGNVVTGADSTAVLTVSPPLENVIYRSNFWDAEPVGADAVPTGVTYEGNTVIADRAALDDAAREIRAQAGPTGRR